MNRKIIFGHPLSNPERERNKEIKMIGDMVEKEINKIKFVE